MVLLSNILIRLPNKLDNILRQPYNFFMSNPPIQDQIISSVLKILNQMKNMEEIPRKFGTDIQIYPSEIHTVAAIYTKPGCNISELAEELGISKPSVSEIIRKLENKKLVERYKLPVNKKEVRLKLTTKGISAAQGHDDFHGEMYSRIRFHMDQIPGEALREFKGALDHINNFMAIKIRESEKGEEI